MSNTQTNNKLTGGQIFWLVVGGLFLLGLFGGNASSSGGGSGTKSTPAVTSSSDYCETTRNKPYRGEQDTDEVLRFIDECIKN